MGALHRSLGLGLLGVALLGAAGCNQVLDPGSHTGGPTAICGDSTTEPPETCDDGNTGSGDGCSSVCFDETDFCMPGIIGTLSAINYPHRMEVAADHVYAITGDLLANGRMYVADVTDPTNPVDMGFVDDPSGGNPAWQPLGIVEQGGALFVSGEAPQLMSYDITTPGSPVPDFIGAPNVNDGDVVVAQDDYLLVANSVAGPGYIYRVDTPGTPTFVTTMGNALDDNTYRTLGVGTNVAYGGKATGTIELWNVTDIESPTYLSAFTPPSAWTIERMVGTDLTIFVATGNAGLAAVNISNPTAPVLADTYLPGTAFYDLALHGSYVYAMNSTGLVVLDVSDPTDMKLAGSNSLPGESGRSVALDPPLAYLGVDGPMRVVEGLPGLCDATCGNLHVEYPEACDDGNHDPGDGCSPGCTVE